MDKPLVSVCTTAYNSEKYLERFIDSFVNQTFKECELVLVDNISTDNTYQIMKKYQEAYPDRIFVYQTDQHYNYASMGRNLAVKKARAEYIYMVDSDDEIACRAVEVLYQAAVNNVYGKADVVMGNAELIEVDGDMNYTVSRYTKNTDCNVSPQAACAMGVEFWTKLIKKELYTKCGDIPAVGFDDVSYVPVLVSHAKHVRCISDVLYYYYRRSDSLTGRPSVDVTYATIAAEENIINKCHKSCIDDAYKFVAIRIYNNFLNRWQYSDLYIEELRRYYPNFANNAKIKALPKVLTKFNYYMGLPSEPIPSTVYLNGFTRTYTDEELEYYASMIFAQGCETVVLSPDNCDVNENAFVKQLFENGDHRETAKYFALKKICENGGIFVDDCIKLVNCFNYCRYFNGFIGMETDESYNDHVFGGRAGNRFFERVLKTYDSGYLNSQNYGLKDRFKLIAVSEFNIPSVVKTPVWSNTPVVVLTPSYITVPFGDKNICYMEYDPSEEDVVTIKKEVLAQILSTHSRAANNVQMNAEANYKQELDAIYASTTWKFASIIMKIGDGPFGPFLKKIYRLFKR